MAAKTDIKRVALIGGSCSGKTTLVGEFSRRGFATIGEAALMVIEELTKEMGADGLANFRQTSLATLQLMIGEKQIEMEARSISINGELVFCDGGLLDPIGYCTYFGITPQIKLLEVATRHRYHRVFSLESLSTFVPRLKAGRMSDRRSSFEIGILLRQVYRQHGYDPIEVPVMPVDERASYILEQLSVLQKH